MSQRNLSRSAASAQKPVVSQASSPQSPVPHTRAASDSTPLPVPPRPFESNPRSPAQKNTTTGDPRADRRRRHRRHLRTGLRGPGRAGLARGVDALLGPRRARAQLPRRPLPGRVGDARADPGRQSGRAGADAGRLGVRGVLLGGHPGRRPDRRHHPRLGPRGGRRGGIGLMLGLLRKHRYFRSHELRASYDAIVIGGGAHGMATAYYLAKTTA